MLYLNIWGSRARARAGQEEKLGKITTNVKKKNHKQKCSGGPSAKRTKDIIDPSSKMKDVSSSGGTIFGGHVQDKRLN